jgi:predicted Rossmann fold nucleotide-binding protein DprA/Smf involved in DNA uptake
MNKTCPIPLNYYGNKDLLGLRKTAFLCSRIVCSTAVLKCYDWAIEQRDKGNCVISGFQSQIEKDVLHYLLHGTQPIIIVLARGLMKRFEKPIQDALSSNRALIISPFSEIINRPTADLALKRNRVIFEMADKIVLGYVNTNGELARLKEEYEARKEIIIL